jgi:HAD superfamily hydrolase (TIGR01662 family)
MKPGIKVILFDLGKTLLFSRFPWQGILSRADAALCDVLEKANITSAPPYTPAEFQACLNNYYDKRSIDNIELTATVVLRDFLANKGIASIPDIILREALDAMYAITQQNWFIEEDAAPALQVLRSSGYHLGLLSNAADDRDVQQLIDQWHLRPFFDFILTSAASGMRKPHPLMFQKALDYFQIQSKQAAMVGDTLTADIAGANNLGIYSIWLTRRIQLPPDGDLAIQPQAIISALAELPALLNGIESDMK